MYALSVSSYEWGYYIIPSMSRILRSFFILAYFFSWCAFIPLALAHQGIIASVPAWLHFAGAFGPLLSAVTVTALTSGRAGLKELVGRMFRWRIGVGWWLVALFSPACLFLIAALIIRLIIHGSGRFQPVWSHC